MIYTGKMLNHDYSSSIFNDNTMDSNRLCVRRVPHKEAEFSSQSIMQAMETFVQAVQDMDETILVPSRLMDLQVGDASDTIELKPKETSTDLYRLYTMVNCVKNELLWGANCPAEEEPEPIQTQVHTSKGHIRRPSTASVASTQSAGLSDTDSETSAENDSGIEGESNEKPDYTRAVEASFKRHLYGLQRSLAQMTAAAAYLTKRYQSDIGANL